MFIKYSTTSYRIPEVANTFTCLPALEELQLNPVDGWKSGFLINSYLLHKPGFLIVFSDKSNIFYVEKHKDGRGKKVSKFKNSNTYDEEDGILDDDKAELDDIVICSLDTKYRIACSSTCFKLQQLDMIDSDLVWHTVGYYSELAFCLEGYLKNSIRRPTDWKKDPSVKDLYNLILDIYKKIENAEYKQVEK
jgi:hypothetical protein